MTISRAELCSRFRQLSVSVICDAAYELGVSERVLPSYLKPLIPGHRIAGVAFTVVGRAIRPAVNWDSGIKLIESYLKVFEQLTPDSILVSSNRGSTVGHFGELTGNSAKRHGCVGVVLDGNLRDLDGLIDIELQVFHRDLSPLNAIGRWQMVSSQVPVTIGDVTVRPGDVIVGDRDGVMALRSSEAEAVLEKAEQIDASESLVRSDMREGRSPWEGLQQHGHI